MLLPMPPLHKPSRNLHQAFLGRGGIPAERSLLPLQKMLISKRNAPMDRDGSMPPSSRHSFNTLFRTDLYKFCRRWNLETKPAIDSAWAESSWLVAEVSSAEAELLSTTAEIFSIPESISFMAAT